MLRQLRSALLSAGLVCLAGCAGFDSAAQRAGPAGLYGARWHSQVPFSRRALRAARDAALEPGTWAPLAGAAVLSIGSLDEDLSDWAVRKAPLFGSKAATRSDDFRDFSTYSYLATALLAPADNWRSKLGGLGVGIGTMLVEGGITEGAKTLSSRQRPDQRGDRSFPSGHAAQTSSRSVLTLRNLGHYRLAPWQRQAARVGYLGLSGATAWARVEANKHYPTDVLVGLALGQFLGNFAHNLWLRDAAPGLGLRLLPEPGGGVVRFTLALP